MSNGTSAPAGTANVPATAFSSWWTPNQNMASQLVIGSQNFTPPNWQTGSIWLVVVDLTTLDVVATDVSTDGSTVPGDISPYAGNPRYFLFAISNLAWASVMPQGPLWNLLVAAGSGAKLNRLAQIYAQLSTGYLGTFSYILAASLAEDDLPGFETLSMNHMTILTMAFMPVTVNGQTIYAPVSQG